MTASPLATIHLADCVSWLRSREANSLHAVVTDPPFTVNDFEDSTLAAKQKNRGEWRRPPAFGGSIRAPVPRFTAMTGAQIARARSFFKAWAVELPRVLVPGAHVIAASTPILMHLLDAELAAAGLERRGVIVRLVQTLRGGDRPKNAHLEFPDVSTMAKGAWEPWLVFRAPFPGTVADCLRRWGTGGLRCLPDGRPFCDVIRSGPTPAAERELADHPSLKPQEFARQIMRASLPHGEGVVADTFMGGGGLVAGAVAVGYRVEGVERRADYFEVATAGIPRLAALP